VGSFVDDQADQFYSSRVYGLSGEVMLNFGPFAVPLGFALLGGFIGWLRRFMAGLAPNDARWLLVPFGIIVSFCLLQADSDNLLFLIVKDGAVPAFAVFLGCSRFRVQQERAQPVLDTAIESWESAQAGT
jgi:hypothetical protein